MKFSLVIPLAPDRNAEIISSLRNLDYPREEFHVIVVKGKNASDNRNKGFEKSAGEIIGFLDDDATVDAKILRNVERFFMNHPNIDIIGGPQLTPLNEKGFAKISGHALGSKFGAWKISNRYEGKQLIMDTDETTVTSANLFCRRKVMEKVKFDVNLFPGEDPKFISDAKKLGFKVAYSPDVIVYHRRRATVSGMIKQIFKYGKVRPEKESFIETAKRPFFLIPSIFVVYLIFLVGFALINPGITGAVIGNKFRIIWIVVLPLALYIFLALIFASYDSAKNKHLTAFFILPLVYLLIHVSYGLGMIYGFVRKTLK